MTSRAAGKPTCRVHQGFFDAVSNGIFDGKHVSDGHGGTTDVSGVMRIKNFDFKSTYWGYETFGLGRDLGEDGKPASTMNMVFKKGNPPIGVLQLIAALPPIAANDNQAISIGNGCRRAA